MLLKNCIVIFYNAGAVTNDRTYIVLAPDFLIFHIISVSIFCAFDS
jgi:hypothetical protein